MAPGEPILIICYSFPPNYGIGGRRWAKFAKELAHRGHNVYVIRREVPEGRRSLWEEDGAVTGIVHHPLRALSPGVLFKWPLTSIVDKVQYHLWMRILPLMTKGNWYDPAARWKTQLLQKAGELIVEHGIRNVVVTGAPFSLLGHACGLKEQFPHINLVSDFRDAWTWAPHYGSSTLSKSRYDHDRALEATVVATSDKVISPHPVIVEHLLQKYGGSREKFVMIPHAIDPDELPRKVERSNEDGVFKLIYAGSLYGAEEAIAYFNILLQTFASMRKLQPDIYHKCRLDLYITSHGTDALAQQVKDMDLSGAIFFRQPLQPRQIAEKLAAADLVMTFIPSINKDILGTKFNEIFHLRRPVLHVGEPGVVSRTILDRHLGDSLRVEELTKELPRIISGERKIQLDPNADLSENLLGPITDRLISEVLR